MSGVLREHAYSGLLWNGAAAVSGAVAQFALFLSMARVLSPEEVGVGASALVVTSIMQGFADGGFGAVIVRNRNLDAAQLTSLFLITLFFGCCLTGLLYLASSFIAGLFDHVEIARLLQITAWIFPLAGMATFFQGLLQREVRFRPVAVADLAASVVLMSAGVIALRAGLGATSLAVGVVAGQVARVILSVGAGLSIWRPKLSVKPSTLAAERGFALFQLGERFVSNVNFYADQLVATSLLGQFRFGQYSFAANLATLPIYRLNSLVNRAAYPLLCRVRDDAPALRRAYLQVIRLVSTINYPFLLGLAVLAPFVVPVVFGPKWSAAIAVMQLLCIASLARTICNPISSLVLASGRADLGFRWNLAISVLCLAATAAGAFAGGLIGVAASQALLYLLLAFGLYWIVVRRLIGRCGRAYLMAFVPPLFASMFVAVCMHVGLSWKGALVGVAEVVWVSICAAIAYALLLVAMSSAYRADLLHFFNWIRSAGPRGKEA